MFREELSVAKGDLSIPFGHEDFDFDDQDIDFELNADLNADDCNLPITNTAPGQILPRTMLAEVRQQMKLAVIDYLEKCTVRAEELARITEINREQKRLKEAGLDAESPRPLPAPVPPILISTTVGAGKSVLVKTLSDICKEANLPLAVLANTHNLCSEHLANNEHNGMQLYRGRVSSDDDKGMPENICYKIEDTERAGENNHRVAASLCRKCEHGMAAAIAHDSPGKEAAIQWFSKRKQSPGDFEPCRYLYEGLPAALAAKQVVAPTAAFSDALGVFKDEDGDLQRLVVVDEHVDLSGEVKIEAEDVRTWIKGIDELLERLKDNKTNDDDNEVNLELIQILPQVRAVFVRLQSAITDNKPIDAAPVEIEENVATESVEIKKSIAEDLIEIKKLVAQSHASWGGTARWESIVKIDEKTYHMPLRALNSIASNIEAGSLRQTANAIHIYELKPLLAWAVERGSLVILDATASQTTKAVVRAAGGEILDIMIKQNIKTTLVTGHLYARGKVNSEAYPRAAAKYLDEAHKIAKLHADRSLAFITHRAYLAHAIPGKTPEEVASRFNEDTGCHIGWFGRHDRGHNAWANCDIVIMGMPILSSEAIAGAYAGCRAVLLQAGRGKCDWPVWDGQMFNDEQRAAAGGVPLPVSDFVRNWLIDSYAATITQAIGRARGVNAGKTIHIWVYGGLQSKEMRAALRGFGVEIDDEVQNTIHKSARKIPDAEAVLKAVEAIEAEGGTVSRPAVRLALAGMSISMDNGKISEQLAILRTAGRLPANKGGRPRLQK